MPLTVTVQCPHYSLYSALDSNCPVLQSARAPGLELANKVQTGSSQHKEFQS